MGRYLYENVTLERVIDGDSIVLAIDAGFTFHRLKRGKGMDYRLAGINAPKGSTPEGKAAKAALVALVTGVPLRAESLPDPEKYGRYMLIMEARVGDQWVNVNQAMLASGHAVLYSGVGKA